MNAKYFYFYIIVFVLLLSSLSTAKAINLDELADICERMESAIKDISLEYEWYNIPPWTIEECEAEMGIPMLIPKDGIRRFKLSAAGLLPNRDPNDANFLLFNRLLLEESTTLVTQEGNSWNNVRKDSWNGKIAKRLNIGGWPREGRTGGISRSKRFFMLPTMLTPLGFSVLRLSICRADEGLPLSARLRDKEFVYLDNSIKKVNGFNTIRADFLTHTNDPNTNKMVYLRIYFSVDHGYTPVRYEHMTGGKPESNNQVALTAEVGSLEQVAERLWFPSSGVISSSDKTRVDAFQTISKILVNQGLTDEHFDIEFPPGTKVRDEIKGVEYTVKSE